MGLLCGKEIVSISSAVIFGSQMHPNDQLRDACCHLANDRRQLCILPDDTVSRAMSPFAKILWPLLFSSLGVL